MTGRDQDTNDDDHIPMDDESEFPEGMQYEEEYLQDLRAKALAQWHQLHDGTLCPADTTSALYAIGRGQLIEASEDVAQYLYADYSEDRRAALVVLGLDFRLPEYAAVALDFLQHDPDVHCRISGASVIGSLRANSHDAALLAALAPIVQAEHEDAYVRRAAYAAMLAVLAYDPRQQFTLATPQFHFPEDVDWALVDRYLPAAP